MLSTPDEQDISFNCGLNIRWICADRVKRIRPYLAMSDPYEAAPKRQRIDAPPNAVGSHAYWDGSQGMNQTYPLQAPVHPIVHQRGTQIPDRPQPPPGKTSLWKHRVAFSLPQQWDKVGSGVGGHATYWENQTLSPATSYWRPQQIGGVWNPPYPPAAGYGVGLLQRQLTRNQSDAPMSFACINQSIACNDNDSPNTTGSQYGDPQSPYFTPLPHQTNRRSVWRPSVTEASRLGWPAIHTAVGATTWDLCYASCASCLWRTSLALTAAFPPCMGPRSHTSRICSTK